VRAGSNATRAWRCAKLTSADCAPGARRNVSAINQVQDVHHIPPSAMVDSVIARGARFA
jgi:hypothetical protein